MKTIELDTEYTLEDRAEKISERSMRRNPSAPMSRSIPTSN